jgi:Tfp pilus assembly protein PilP
MRAFRNILLVLSCGMTLVAFPLAAQEAPATAEPTGFEFEDNLEELLQEPLGADAYRYDSQGRRDPFRSLIGPARTALIGERPPGTPGFLVDEIVLSGVFRTKQSLVAMISGPDNMSHLLRVGDKVFDGEVVRVTPTSLVFRQEVNDPTRIERFREVVKELSPQSVKN